MMLPSITRSSLMSAAMQFSVNSLVAGIETNGCDHSRAVSLPMLAEWRVILYRFTASAIGSILAEKLSGVRFTRLAIDRLDRRHALWSTNVDAGTNLQTHD